MMNLELNAKTVWPVVPALARLCWESQTEVFTPALLDRKDRDLVLVGKRNHLIAIKHQRLSGTNA
jgi:hypothetical protein